MKMKKLVIFDLDGTLLNTIGDLAAACDVVLKGNDLPTYTLEEYKVFVGSGMMRLVEQVIPESHRNEQTIAKMRSEFIKAYYQNIDVHTEPYDGITQLLKELQYNGIEVAVASNKFQEGTRKLVEKFFPSIRFVAVLGQRPRVPLKPNPQILRDVMQISSYAADKILYVGDSGIDIETGIAAGIDTIGVSWGFRSREELENAGAEHIIDSPRDLWRFIEK
ncbi:MAG: HAD family hydrolase [Rikenellaceae bacterium]